MTGLLAGGVSLALGNFVSFDAVLPETSSAAAEISELRPVSLKDTLLNAIPLNPFEALASENILQVIFFAVIFGIALSFQRESESEIRKAKAETLFRFCSGVSEIMFILIRCIMLYAPIGVFALAVDAFGKNGADALAPLSKFVGTAYGAFIFQIIVVYGLLLKLAGRNVADFVARSRDVMLTAFVTRSSGAALPVALETAEEKLTSPKTSRRFPCLWERPST